MTKKGENIDFEQAADSLYGEPEKKRIRRKTKDATKRPNRNWKNRKLS